MLYFEDEVRKETELLVKTLDVLYYLPFKILLLVMFHIVKEFTHSILVHFLPLLNTHHCPSF